MTPTFEPGQFVLFEPGGGYDVGDVVVAHHPSQDRLLVKRVAATESIGLVELRSDNAAIGTDSRRFGRIDADTVVGVVTTTLDWPLAPIAGAGLRSARRG